MPVTITMPALSPTMEDGTLSKWLVAAGDKVAPGDVIAEIETDKAVMEVEAVDEGVVAEILVAEGTEGVKVNAPIARLLEEGEDDASPPAPPPPRPSTPPAAPSGDAAQTASPVSPMAPAAPVAAKPAAPGAGGEGQRLFATPLARRIAAFEGVALSALQGSGPHGRIVKADVEAAIAAGVQTPATATTNTGGAPATPAPAAPTPAAPTPTAPTLSAPSLAAGPGAEQVKRLYEGRAYEEVPLDGMRRAIAARLTEAKQTIPHFYLRREIALDPLLTFRADLNTKLEARGVKISVNDFIIKACARALMDVPDCNAAWAGDRILKFAAADIAVAVAIEGGLITPVVRDAEVKTISAVSTEMKDLAARARARKLAPGDYQGGAFAVSNLGMMGIENFDAVINPPHGAILAVGAGLRKPVVRGEGVEIATVMSVTLSADHRVIDGALGAELLASIAGYLEAPITLLA